VTASSIRVTSCIDCGTPLIGEQLRCPACHDVHARDLIDDTGDIAGEITADDAVTAPRPRARRGWHSTIAWFVGLQFALAIVLGLVVAVRGCSP
jgi:hypothetical protein